LYQIVKYVRYVDQLDKFTEQLVTGEKKHARASVLRGYIQTNCKLNKRAQRALGRSPEEKVKGQGEAIYRGPLMLSTKYW